jgi:outer membrane immunogenic protein
MRKASRLYVLGAALVALSSTTALADGLPSRARYGLDGCCSWAGTYFGLHLGYGWADSDVTFVPSVGPLFPDSLDAKGWLAGIHVGHNIQLGGLVLGAELSYSKTGIDESKTDCFAPGSGIACSTENDWLLLAMGRVGVAPISNFMVYGTAGYALAGVTSNLNIAGLNANFLRTSAVHDGFAFGAGIEYQVKLSQSGNCCNSAVFGLEYVHVNLEDRTHQSLLVRDVDQDLNIVRARLSIKFDPCNGCGPRGLK